MATSIAAPNVQRLVLPDIEFSYDGDGIISIIDDLVERVMSAHMKKSLSMQTPTSHSSDAADVVSFRVASAEEAAA